MKSLEEIADSFPGRDLVPMADLIAFVDERIQSKVRRSWHKAGGFRLGSEKDPLQPPRPTVESKQSRGRRHVQHESKMRSTMEVIGCSSLCVSLLLLGPAVGVTLVQFVVRTWAGKAS